MLFGHAQELELKHATADSWSTTSVSGSMIPMEKLHKI